MADTFADLWKRHPRKIAKKAAEKAYNKAIQTARPEAIAASHEVMLATEWKGRKPEYIPHLASWINRESFEERTEALFDDCERPLGRHLCCECPVEHEWEESGPAYNWIQQWLLACPQAHAAMKAAGAKA